MEARSGAKPAGLGVVITSCKPRIAVPASYRPPFRPTRGSSAPERALTKTLGGGGGVLAVGAAADAVAVVWAVQRPVAARVRASARTFRVERGEILRIIVSPSACDA